MKKLIIALIIIPIVMGIFAFRQVQPQSVTEPQVAVEDAHWFWDILNGDYRGKSNKNSQLSLASPSEKVAKKQIENDSAEKEEPQPEEDYKEFVSIDDELYEQRLYKTLGIPNDPEANQWWVQNTNLDDAWGTPEGSHETLLAVIDSGFALNHEEFENRWYENSGEAGATASENPSDLNCTDQGIPLDESCNNIDDDADGIADNESGPTDMENVSILNCTDQGVDLDKSCNLIDDDGNGYVDDWRGYDFINGERSSLAGEVNPDGDGVDHGTNVTGAAAATRNNSKGIAGVSGTSKILPLQGLSDDGWGYTTSIGFAVRYAADAGADVISMSLGSEHTDVYLQSAIIYANSKGSVVVAASGNDGCNCVNYPANYQEVVAVGASNSSNTRYSFSNYGANLDVLAPGAGIYTTDWTPGNETTAYESGIAGTSIATPIVAGQLAVLKSHNPDLSPTELVSIVTENTNRTGISSTQPRYNAGGFGRVDIGLSVERINNSYTPPITYEFAPVSYGNTLDVETTGDGHAVRVYDCDIYGEHGTTPLFKINPSSDSSYYTSSYAEQTKALQLGATDSFLAHLCVLLPHDTPGTTRIINPEREF